ncbi:MAG TPA: alpha-amylase family glycosyl hydrolase [Armatimonadota bacterium]|nr:alpha-amylase family glycosyl hydrolase [Armatimonadota bacterium]
MTPTPIQRQSIPALPERPRVHPVSDHIRRSYPVGHQSFSRAYRGDVLTLTISMEEPLAENVQASLVTTLNSSSGSEWDQVSFVRSDERTLTCRVTPQHPGLHSFRAEFSLDSGASWLRDTVPDAWILIDPPQADSLRLYTLIPTVSGTLADWKADLSRIRDMGFNAIHLLPITTLGRSESPYAARDLFDVDPGYLAPGSQRDGLSQLEEFIQEARKLNIRLCFDLVLNHVGVESTMAVRATDWIVPDQDEKDGLRRARYWSGQGWRTWDDLVLINYEHPSEAIRSEIWAYMTDYALFWANYASVTGGFVRFDNLHSSDPDFIQALSVELHSKYPEVCAIAEYFTDETTLLRTGPQWGLNLILATPWNHKYAPDLREYLINTHRVAEHVRYYMPITSHDSGAPAQEFGTADSTVPRYVAAALLGTGATGIPQGVEFGERERIDFIGRKPKMQYPAEPRFERFIGRVNGILADHPAFRRGGNCQFVDGGHPAIIAAFRRGAGTQALGYLVVCNFDVANPQSITVDLSSFLSTNGPLSCTELLSGEARIYPGTRLELRLPACTAEVLMFPRSNESPA